LQPSHTQKASAKRAIKAFQNASFANSATPTPSSPSSLPIATKGRHLANIILANAVDPTTNSARTFTSIFPGVLPFTFTPRPHDSQELPKIYAQIKGEHATIMRKTFESISIPHLTRLLIDASPAQQHKIFSTISSKLHPTSVATITFHFHRSSIVPQYNIIIGVTYQTIGITPESIMQQLSLILPDLIPTTANSPGVDINLLIKNPSIGPNVTPPTFRAAQPPQSTGKPSRPSYRSSVLAILPNSSINPSQSHPNPQAQAQGQGHPGINSEPPIAGFNPNLFYAVFSVKGMLSPAVGIYRNWTEAQRGLTQVPHCTNFKFKDLQAAINKIRSFHPNWTYPGNSPSSNPPTTPGPPVPTQAATTQHPFSAPNFATQTPAWATKSPYLASLNTPVAYEPINVNSPITTQVPAPMQQQHVPAPMQQVPAPMQQQQFPAPMQQVPAPMQQQQFPAPVQQVPAPMQQFPAPAQQQQVPAPV
jgi:hypothetical protein